MMFKKNKVTDLIDDVSAAADADGQPPGMLIALSLSRGEALGLLVMFWEKFESQLNKIQLGVLKHSFLPSLLGSCLSSRVPSTGYACTPAPEMRWWASYRSDAVAGMMVRPPHPTPIPTVPQFTRNKKIKDQRNKQKNRKNKSPHPQTGPASTP